MRIALVALGLITVAAVVALALKGGGALGAALRTSGQEALKLVPILALAFFLMGATKTLLPDEVVERWLSDAAGWRGIAVAWVAGALTPAGSIVGLPLAAGLHQAAVGAAVLVTYLTSVATLSLIRLPLEVGIIGLRLALLRTAACLLLPPVAGLLTRLLLAARPS